MKAKEKTMGNIDLAEAWTQLDIAQHAEDSIRHLAARQQPTAAEIFEGGADWYLVHTYPGDDLRALRWLARRRFGVFRPMQQLHDKRNETQVVQGWEPVFPGWLFVFCWDIEKMRGRILSCPGVMEILCDPVTQKPIAIDQRDEHGKLFIDKLRELGWIYDEAAPALSSVRSHAAVRAARQAKRSSHRLTPKERRNLQNLKNQVKERHIWDQGTWERANALDPGQRIALLELALTGTADVRLPGFRV